MKTIFTTPQIIAIGLILIISLVALSFFGVPVNGCGSC